VKTETPSKGLTDIMIEVTDQLVVSGNGENKIEVPDQFEGGLPNYEAKALHSFPTGNDDSQMKNS
jgi:hypothetical protein